MRRTFLLLGVAAFVLVVAMPAAAAPKAFSFDTVCDFDGDGSLDGESPFVSIGNHFPGWTQPWSPGDGLSGGVILGGTQVTTTYPSGEVVATFTWGPPPGLESRLTLCSVAGPRESTPFKVLVYPAWVFFPSGPPA